MDIERFKCNLLNTFQNDDHTVLDKWLSSCRMFRQSIDAKIQQGLLYEKGTVLVCFDKLSDTVGEESRLRNEKLFTKA